MLATINPGSPIYDSPVALCLGLTVVVEDQPERKVAQALWLFGEITEFHKQAANHAPLVAAFDKQFPEFRHFHSVKKIDFLMWRDGARRLY